MRCRCQLRYGHTHVLYNKLFTRISSSPCLSKAYYCLALAARPKKKLKIENSCLMHAHLDLGHKASQRKNIINVETEFIWFYFKYFTELLIGFSPQLENLCSNSQKGRNLNLWYLHLWILLNKDSGDENHCDYCHIITDSVTELQQKKKQKKHHSCLKFIFLLQWDMIRWQLEFVRI